MEGIIGEIRIFAGSFAPYGWAFCNGAILPITQWPAVYSILGTTYGGDGRTNFALPTLPAPAGVEGTTNGQYIICLQGYYPQRP